MTTTSEAEMPTISFSGSQEVQEAASRAFDVLRARGMFMSDSAPIRVRKDELIAFLTESAGANASVAENALAENPDVFAIETNDEGLEVVITSRLGKVPGSEDDGLAHTFTQRLMTPEPKPARPAAPVRERVRVAPSWATYTVPDFKDDEEEAAYAEELRVAQAQEAAAAAEAQAAEVAAAERAEAAEAAAAENARLAAEAIAAEEARAAEILAALAPAEAPVEAVDAPAAVAEADVETPVEEAPVETVAEVAREQVSPVVEEPVVAATPQPVAKTVPAAPAPSTANLTDVSGYDDAQITAALVESIASDARVARFADRWMSEDRVPRLSRGDIRRIKDYIDEQEVPLTDETLVQDILGVRPNQPNYQLTLFAVNFRLSRERDFEFLGTNDQRFWATTTLPAIGTDRRKHNDIGTDYRFLTEAVAEDVAHRSVESIDHVVTFYEYTLGLLPYDEEMQKLMPAAVEADQRNAIFTFEIPQTYTTYLVELRYPTPTRGGFLLGLDDFYADSIVPGAMISISATENDGHFKIEYLAAEEQSDRLLELDDRRSPRYHFRPTTYSCAVDDAWLINEDRFPNLGSERPLADKLRRRNDEVLRATFERIGMDAGDGGKLASFEDLLAVVNIERPFSEDLLRAALEQDANVSGDDANGYTYVTGS